jgi:DNA-binding response OmpR family regulator
MKNILLIEHDQNLAAELCVRLKAHGYAIWIANDAISALSLATSQKPDLIVLDRALVAGNAFDLASRLKELPETRQIPIVLTTTTTEPSLRQRATELGVVAILQKPYDTVALVTIVRRILPDPLFNAHPLRFTGEFSWHNPQARRKKVLIVEDDEKLAMALALRIRAAGFEITVAADGLAGVRNAVQVRPDAVVLDISLPAGDGFSVAQRIHAVIPTPIPIIFLTASKRQEFRERARELGAAAFFEKPYQPEALLAAIHHATG